MQPSVVKYQVKKETQVTKNKKNVDIWNKIPWIDFPMKMSFFWNSMILPCMEFFKAKSQVFQLGGNPVLYFTIMFHF